MYPCIYLLSKARHIIAAHHALTQATPSFLEPRMPPLPRVVLVTPSHSQEDDEEKEEKNMAVLHYVLGENEDGTPGGMLDAHFVELIDLMRPA
jgi:hypothetical protein